MSFNLVSQEAIREGEATDRYFLNTEKTLDAVGRNPYVVAEVTESQMPNGTFKVISGMPDVAELFEGIPVDVDAIPSGRLFDGGPVLRIEGNYRDFARFETALLGFLSQASAFATAAAEARIAAPNTPVLSFGSRHLNPALAGVLERNALIGGLDGISNVAAGEMLDEDVAATMPHALIIAFGKNNQEEAWASYNSALDGDEKRIALCDTFSDEVDEVLRAVETLGDDLDGVRLDTTGSRRGDFKQIIQEVRWELEAIGREDVDIVVSGGITPESMRELRNIVDGFGVGSYISDADPLDFGLDIVEIEGEAISKRGKYSGVKEVYRTTDGRHAVRPKDDSSVPNSWTSLLKPLVRDGEVVREESVQQGQSRLENDMDRVGVDNISQ